MLVKGIDNDKCERRNRLSAQKGVNVVPLLFVGSSVASSAVSESKGSLADDMDGAIKAINAMQPQGAKPLGADDVWVHYVEAANQNFIRKYYMFFSQKSLQNFAADAVRGVAFMNSHRTGDVSTPSELPFGNTFGGRYELLANGTARTLVGIYMRRGVQPNGANGPSTDDLHAQIEGGIQNADSVGVPAGGNSICAVCANPLNAQDENGQYLCSHAPGTPRNMTPDDRKRMKALGVPNGYAAFILDDAHLAEVSAVYSGALPGAGVRKVLSLARQHQLSETDMVQARRAYGDLINGKDLGMDVESMKALEDTVARGTRRGIRAGNRTVALTSDNPPAPPAQLGADSEAVKLRAEVARLGAELRSQRSSVKAKELSDSLRLANKLTPTEQAPLRAFAAALFSLCEASPDMVKMTSADNAEITLAQGLEALMLSRPTMALTGQQLPDQYGALHALPEASGADAEFDAVLNEVNTIIGVKPKNGGR